METGKVLFFETIFKWQNTSQCNLGALLHNIWDGRANTEISRYYSKALGELRVKVSITSNNI